MSIRDKVVPLIMILICLLATQLACDGGRVVEISHDRGAQSPPQTGCWTRSWCVKMAEAHPAVGNGMFTSCLGEAR